MAISLLTTDSLTPLVLQAQAGDRDAFGDLVVLFESRIFGIVMQRLRNTAEADEVVQEVFLRAFRKLPQLQEAERFGGWLCQIAVRGLWPVCCIQFPSEARLQFFGIKRYTPDETDLNAKLSRKQT